MHGHLNVKYGERRFIFHSRAVSRLPFYFCAKNELFYADENFLVESEKQCIVHCYTCITFFFLKRFDEVACAVEVVKYCHSVQLLGNNPNFLLSLNKKLNFSGLYSSP